ncbi:MAG: PopZ family protein [Zhengella sp.]|uniref:DUF2497 domain-containing protein n=1 Tax=Zhengella sp. TaxID=2282762 RepID=UPI001D48FEAF|nr:PopZ family protein [Notoacmeibacter sp.]MCC0027127.1 DUF2497 domain-containing protein [Brucellaceae bacterium]
MAQAGGAQREPSMEEILASIRKIIEETEHTRDDAPPAAVAPQKPAEAAASEPVQVRREADISAFRDAIADMGNEPDDEAETQVAGPGMASAAITLAEVQRRLAREDREEEDPDSSFDATAQDVEPGTDMTPALEGDDEMAASTTGEPAAFHAEATAQAGPVQPQQAAPEFPDEHVTTGRSETVALNGARAALMSPDAGRQVAGSFDELKEAFMASRQKSFDEMAQEMLRPMLQDWLDNNLPVLVERLVREEIERIARG